MTVRTRVAPSPTGDPHVGTAYIALFNWLFAKQHGGQFILRIEDTDQVRSSIASEKRILAALKWLGIDWDEGPGKSGKYGPYQQSQRGDLYKDKVIELLEAGHAFHCFCKPERLDSLRKRQMENKQKPGYDGHCLDLTEKEISEKMAACEPYVIRMKIPSDGGVAFKDMLRGSIDIHWSEVDMQVLLKADGMPTYHLANVVDDHEMAITHVIRGEEWINSTPKHVLLYQYFGWQVPEFCHMPLLRNPDKSKLSKRKNPTSILYYQRMGFLPEALINYLGRMGWSMPDEREKFSLSEMLENFDINRVSLGGPVFDVDKLKWLNGQWIRDIYAEPESFANAVKDWSLNSSYIYPMLEDVAKRVELLSDLPGLMSFYFSGALSLTEVDFEHKRLSQEEVKEVLQLALWDLEKLDDWGKTSISKIFECLAEKMELKLKDLMLPIFIAITGQASSVPVMNAMVCLGPDMTRARLRQAIQTLGGLSKKALKRLEKQAK